VRLAFDSALELFMSLSRNIESYIDKVFRNRKLSHLCIYVTLAYSLLLLHSQNIGYYGNNCNNEVDEGCGPICGDGYCDGLAFNENCNTCLADCPRTSKGACCCDGRCDSRKGETALWAAKIIQEAISIEGLFLFYFLLLLVLFLHLSLLSAGLCI